MKSLLLKFRAIESTKISSVVLLVSSFLIIINISPLDLPIVARIVFVGLSLLTLAVLFAKLFVDIKIPKAIAEEDYPEVFKKQINEGWYPTPDNEQERYYNGSEWTDQFRARTAV